MEKELVSIKRASRALGIAMPTLYSLVKKHRIPAHRFGDRILLSLSEVLAATRVPAEDEPSVEDPDARR